jgi:hypothetical protein
MNILILTPTHPVQIAEMINFMSQYYNEENDIFSVQSMALLGEETFRKHHFMPLNFTYAAEVRNNPKLCLRKERGRRKNIIIYGNLDRNTDMKFDHILGFSSMDHKEGDDTFDGYLKEGQKMYDEVFDNLKIKRIDWYKKEDAHHIFPTLHHLEVMLNTLGVKKNDNAIQQETVTSD